MDVKTKIYVTFLGLCLFFFGLWQCECLLQPPQSLSDAVRLARRADGDWLVELIKIGESQGMPMMRKFFWQVMGFMAIWEIVKRLIGHADEDLVALFRRFVVPWIENPSPRPRRSDEENPPPRPPQSNEEHPPPRPPQSNEEHPPPRPPQSNEKHPPPRPPQSNEEHPRPPPPQPHRPPSPSPFQLTSNPPLVSDGSDRPRSPTPVGLRRSPRFAGAPVVHYPC